MFWSTPIGVLEYRVTAMLFVVSSLRYLLSMLAFHTAHRVFVLSQLPVDCDDAKRTTGCDARLSRVKLGSQDLQGLCQLGTWS